MRITSLDLYRYLPFVFNDVELLELDFTSDVQNIIGSNGAGKSSLLRVLNPRAAVRGDFGEGGYKHMSLTHRGIEYRLESNFSNTSKPHSFLRGDEELNTSGTGAVQEELVRRELGYTPQVHALCYGEQRLSSIRVGLRETHLLTIHPCQMKLLLDKHKIVEKKLRGFSNNLSLLHERRAAVATQLIEPAIRDQLQCENETLTHELAATIGAIHKLNHQKRQIVNTLNAQPALPQVREMTDHKRAQRRYPLFTHISRDQSLEELRTLASGELSSLRTQLDSSTQHIRALTLEIDKYEQHLRQSDAQGAIDEMEAMLQTLQHDIDLLRADVLERPFDVFSLPELPNHISKLADLLAPFLDYRGMIPSMREVGLMQTKYEINTRRLSTSVYEEAVLVDRVHAIETRLRDRVLDAIPEKCHDCVLFQQYNVSVQGLQAEYNQVDRELQRQRLRKHRLDRLVQGRDARLTDYRQIVPAMQKLQAYLNEYRFLLIPLHDLDMLTTMRENPSLLLIRLQTHYERSRNHHLRLKKQEELARRSADYERLKTPSEFGRQFLETMVVDKQHELTNLRHTYRNLMSQLADKEAFLALLSDYAHELQRLGQEQQALDQKETMALLSHDSDICTLYLTTLEAHKVKTVTRLAEIDRLVREQDGLTAALHEIQTTIVNIEILQREHQEIERGLSPSEGIPYRYMVSFINDLIAVANQFIAQVFSYPFEFIPLVPGDPLTYKFRMLVGDVKRPDISECSEAQMDFADFAWRLAQIIHLKHNEYGIYLDEIDRAYDHYHKHQLLDLLKILVPTGVVQQLFMINHNATTYTGVIGAETLVLNDTNIILPQDYNTHARLVRYGTRTQLPGR
jgi:hypothetical protein